MAKYNHKGQCLAHSQSLVNINPLNFIIRGGYIIISLTTMKHCFGLNYCVLSKFMFKLDPPGTPEQRVTEVHAH